MFKVGDCVVVSSRVHTYFTVDKCILRVEDIKKGTPLGFRILLTDGLRYEAGELDKVYMCKLTKLIYPG